MISKRKTQDIIFFCLKCENTLRDATHEYATMIFQRLSEQVTLLKIQSEKCLYLLERHERSHKVAMTLIVRTGWCFVRNSESGMDAA